MVEKRNDPTAQLGQALRSLLERAPVAAHLEADPLRFPRRYSSPDDIEVAAVVSACLAFGRVSLFGPVLASIFTAADRFGGPAAFVDGLDSRREATLAGLYYRWHPTGDLVGLLRVLGWARREHGSLGRLFAPGPLEASLGGAIERLREAPTPGVSPHFRTFFPHPQDGSACKRWCMLLRWMVRPEAPDLGVWTHLSPANLVIPVDTHIFRVARFLGLTTRATPGWATALEITASLARYSPSDPVRYDFVLAHLGISGACRGFRDPDVCQGCMLNLACRAPAGNASR